MSLLFLILQGGLFGVVAGELYPGLTWEFFALIAANSVLTVAYGFSNKTGG